MSGIKSVCSLKDVHDLAIALALQVKNVEMDTLLREEIKNRKRTLGDWHQDTLESSHNLCVLLVAQGRLESAEHLNRQVFKDRKKVFGLEHPDSLKSLYQHATILATREADQNRTAESLKRDDFSAMEKALGPGHPLESVKAYADGLWRQRKHKDARNILQQVIIIYEKILGVEHLVTLAVVKALADMLVDEEKYSMAETVYRRLVHGLQNRLGKKNTLVLANIYTLSIVLAKQDKYNASDEEFYQRALYGKEKELGQKHSVTLECVDNLSEALWRQNKYAEAEKIYRQAVAVRTKTPGPTHATSRISMNNLVVTLECQGKRSEARKVIKLGLGGTYIAESSFPLTDTLARERQYLTVVQMMRRVVEGRKKVLGLEHFDTVKSIRHLAYSLGKLMEHTWCVNGEIQEQEMLYRQELRFNTTMLGPENPTTLKSSWNLANVLRNQGDFLGAERILYPLLKSREAILGLWHDDTLEVANFLISVLGWQNKSQAIEEVSRRFSNDEAESTETESTEDNSEVTKPPLESLNPRGPTPDQGTDRQSDFKTFASRETAAFLKAARECEDFIVMEKTNSFPIYPIKLLNIRTGKVFFPSEKARYVIASYIWHPQYLPSNPFEGLLKGRLGREINDPIEFDKRLNNVCEAFPEFVTRSNETADTSNIVFPTEYCSGLAEDHQREVYLLTALEANLRGLDYIWMDCLCIDQMDEKDKADNIPLMAGYYQRAECCVVVAEVLRRKLCFDVSSTSSLDFDWVPGDDLLSWIVGFHHLRTWLLQETFLSPVIVTRSAHVRIESSQFFIEYNEHFVSKIFSCPAFLCKDPNYTHYRGTVSRFPTSVSRTKDDQALTRHECMELIRHRGRAVTQDRVYGGLGLFSPGITRSMPVDYQLSTGSLYAILTYLRICTGETSGLLTLRCSSEKRHQIEHAPSWIPSGTGAVFLDGFGQPLTLPDQKGANMKWPSTLFRNMQYMYIEEMKPKEIPSSGSLIDYNVLLTVRSCQNHSLPVSFEGVIEPLGYWPNSEAVKEDIEDYNAGMREIKDALKTNRAVVALLGQQKTTSVWMILCAVDDGKTWKRWGLARTSGISQKEMEKNRSFCIT